MVIFLLTNCLESCYLKPSSFLQAEFCRVAAVNVILVADKDKWFVLKILSVMKLISAGNKNEKQYYGCWYTLVFTMVTCFQGIPLVSCYFISKSNLKKTKVVYETCEKDMEITTKMAVLNLKLNGHHLRVCFKTQTTVLQSQQFLLRVTFFAKQTLIF